MDTYYIDGEFVPDNEAVVSVKDIAVLRGVGVFDFLRTYNRRPFHLEEHITRLENSAKCIGLTLKHSAKEICAIVDETMKKNPHHVESNIRIVYTGGISPDGLTPAGNGKLMVMITPKKELPASWYQDGAGIALVDMERFIPESKSTSYLCAVAALQKGVKHAAIESVYVDRSGRILEGTTTNFFFFNGKKLVTPGKDILPGITRSVVLKLAKDEYDVQVRDIAKTEISDMEEVFITASNKEIVPIVRIDNRVVGSGKPGKRTQDIMQRFRHYTDAYAQGAIK